MRVRRTETELSKARRLLRQAKRNTYLRDRYWTDPEYRERRRQEARDRARARRADGIARAGDSKTLRCPVCDGLTRVAKTRTQGQVIERSRWCGSCRLEIRTTEVVVELVNHNVAPSEDGALIGAAS